MTWEDDIQFTATLLDAIVEEANDCGIYDHKHKGAAVWLYKGLIFNDIVISWVTERNETDQYCFMINLN